MSYTSDLTDEQWEYLKDYIPPDTASEARWWQSKSRYASGHERNFICDADRLPMVNVTVKFSTEEYGALVFHEME